MASAFKNAGMTVVTTDDASANLYTATRVTSVVHAVYISNKRSTNTAKIDVKDITDGGSTFYNVGKRLEIDVNNRLVLEKPINLEANDIIRAVAAVNSDSS